ncbi:copper resistance CopC family protein [Pseudonocardia dioxanivorans]|uniref:copper resistance CopC family protein n=1 Tax=Pseudonocardia dioxanivorans TaxID=240495 RepID=UPI001F1BD140|nr:copper resistance CopC family protein [Pseudonocardia dioxanivorans]
MSRAARLASRAVAVLVAAGLALFLGAGPASAHAQLEGSDPPDGASLATGPSSVTIHFSDSMQAGFNTVTVIGPDHLAYQQGQVTAANDSVTTGVMPLGPAGRYEIGYRVVSDDGHPVQGSVSFTLTRPGPGKGVPIANAPQAADAAPGGDGGSGGAPVWPWIVGAVVLVAGGVALALRLGRS